MFAAIDAEELARTAFADAGVAVEIETRQYPEETILVVRVRPDDYDRALTVSESVETALAEQKFPGFLTVRKARLQVSPQTPEVRRRGVHDERASNLANLLTARSRTSEVQPSLEYVPDASHNISAITTHRNHLIFGRRGAGKTSLMVEAKRQLVDAGTPCVWLNIQTHRHAGAETVFLWVASAVCQTLQLQFSGRQPRLMSDIATLGEAVNALLAKETVPRDSALRLVPHLQQAIRRSLEASGGALFIFLDDLHYLRRTEQPQLLDLVHAVTRDLDAWIKIACIRHLSRWFEHSPPTGLQTGHDADHIDLDLTLESPSEAKVFLDRVLDTYARHVGLPGGRSVLSEDALNRLVLASGAVPRDYLVLAAGTIRHARKRQKARYAGVQDVNRAAGDQSKVKIAELEDDAAASQQDGPTQIIRALTRIRSFCLDATKYTYFRVDFHDKEDLVDQYALIQSLLDVRILHMVASSLSDKHEAGRRSEVFMLDLSQFTGQRFKKYIYVLDFVAGRIVLRKTSSAEPDRIGDSPHKLADILRRGPLLRLAEVTTQAAPVV